MESLTNELFFKNRMPKIIFNCYLFISVLFTCCSFKLSSIIKIDKRLIKNNINTTINPKSNILDDRIDSNKIELITIYSIGGEGKNVDYSGYDINKLFDLDDKGPYADSYFINGCDGGLIKCRAINSNVSFSAIKIRHNKRNLVDQNPMTAWGESNVGNNTFFEIYCNNLNTIFNGNQKSPANWFKNSRVKKFKIYIDNKPLCFMILKDEMGEQNFELPFDADWNTGHLFKFEIIEVYSGSENKDVYISEIGVQGCCFSENSILKGINGEKSINQLNDSIFSYDKESNNLTPSIIEEKIFKYRSELYNITVKNKKTTVTREHRFTVQNYGNLSIMEMISKLKLNSYQELCNNEKIKLAVLENDSLVYYPINKIERIKGNFKTASVRKLSIGKTIVVDGFIQEIEKTNIIKQR